MKKVLLYLLIVFAATGCSVGKFLPPGEKLYKGHTININKHPDVKERDKALKSKMAIAVRPVKNKFLLGHPWKVWWWYKLGAPTGDKGFKNFLRRRLVEEPVLSSKVNTVATSENIASFMDNNGYFRTTASGDTVNSGYFTKAVYNVNVQPQYHINDIRWVSDSSEIMKLLENPRGKPVLRKGDAYSLDNIKAERQRLDIFLKTKGYYFFNPTYIMSYIDSTPGDRKVNIFLNLKNTTPEEAKQAFAINNIVVFPNYSLGSESLDTSFAGIEYVDSIFIADTVKKFRPMTFTKAITYRPDVIYNNEDQNFSLNRLISLGAFKFVKNRFEKVKGLDSTNKLNAFYYLTPSLKKSLQGQVDGFTKDNNYIGGQFSINFLNRNAFKGAEQLLVKPYIGFETATNDSLKGNNNLRLGATTSLKIPRYAVPFLNIRENNFYLPNTNIGMGYELYMRRLLYSKNSFNASYEFTWKRNPRELFSLAPISLNYFNTWNITDSFYNEVAARPSLIYNVLDEALLGTYFKYSYTAPRPKLSSRLFYSGGVDLSGNIMGLVTGAKDFRSKSVFGAPFAQFIKLDAAVHYAKILSPNLELANRVEVGYGIPYGNSRYLPFSKQYTIGGASTLRGFPTRSIGPGLHVPSATDQLYYQIIGGDMRLLGNTELRLKLTSMFGAALFVDAGNIWTKDTLLFGEEGKFSKKFLDQLAVNTGLGFRVDLTFLLLRIDLGIPIRKPYLTGNKWVFNQVDFGNKYWRRENLVLNFAIGLPF